MRCSGCQWNYPEHYLNGMVIGKTRTEPICGICALGISNEISGVKRTEFFGAMAERFRQDAIKWRMGHPWEAPK